MLKEAPKTPPRDDSSSDEDSQPPIPGGMPETPPRPSGSHPRSPPPLPRKSERAKKQTAKEGNVYGKMKPVEAQEQKMKDWKKTVKEPKKIKVKESKLAKIGRAHV